jgi:hypothetical protein
VKSLLLAGAALQRTLEAHGWRFCFIGGVANFRWGTPRLTNDLDLTLLTGFGAEAAYVETLLGEFESRVPDAAAFAAANRVLLLRTRDGFALDIALGAMPFEERTIERSSLAELVPGATMRTCSAEDLKQKVLPPELTAGVNVERFNREILLAARLQHPHIVLSESE